MTKELPAVPGLVAANSDRREYLRNYLLACLRDNVMSQADLFSLGLAGKLRSTVVGDLAALSVAFATQLGIGILRRVQRGR